jgi:hypothetical protein
MVYGMLHLYKLRKVEDLKVQIVSGTVEKLLTKMRPNIFLMHHFIVTYRYLMIRNLLISVLNIRPELECPCMNFAEHISSITFPVSDMIYLQKMP